MTTQCQFCGQTSDCPTGPHHPGCLGTMRGSPTRPKPQPDFRSTDSIERYHREMAEWVADAMLEAAERIERALRPHTPLAVVARPDPFHCSRCGGEFPGGFGGCAVVGNEYFHHPNCPCPHRFVGIGLEPDLCMGIFGHEPPHFSPRRQWG